MENNVKVWAGLGAAVVLTAGVMFVTTGGSTAADTQPSLEEDFTHPGAARILEEHGLEVFKGDGRIWFDTSRTFDTGPQCAVGDVQVEQLLDAPPYGIWYCFKTKGTDGYLTLKVPGTFGVRGGNQPLTAKAELPDGVETFNIGANQSVPIRPGSGDDMPQAILVELRLAG
ncbi:hypothetical protein HCA58_21740 [Micromonospora sp. HNM0581]|uniref:hypothetical protein n=1 Tax=Micromonospora sp. HNM0581 TaxID=2716341 RepID=UPI00146C447B|nr:hypothetical protein [Micromonospora sp. HNM0581]NLU80931.1 hypothetical protein [Micromonospora sp. HNM0581]